jgi:hypothetical protein
VALPTAQQPRIIPGLFAFPLDVGRVSDKLLKLFPDFEPSQMDSRHLAFGLLVASLFSLGCSKGDPTKLAEGPQPVPSSGNPNPDRPGLKPTSDPPKKQPAGKPIELTAEQWGKEAAEAEFDKKYFGKTVRVSGKVKKTLGENVYLETGVKAANSNEEVVIVLAFAEPQKVKPGDLVVVEGEYNLLALGGDPSCKNCRLVQNK